MSDTGAIRPYRVNAYGRNTGGIQREERGFLTVEEGGFCLSDPLPGRWCLMLLNLAGQPLPPLPAIQGRVHAAPPSDGTDHRAASFERAAAWPGSGGLGGRDRSRERSRVPSGTKPRGSIAARRRTV